MHRKVGLALLITLLSPLAIASTTPRKEFHQTLAIAAGGQVSIDGHNGSVKVSTWNQPNVAVDAVIVPSDSSDYPEDVQKVVITAAANANGVTVHTDFDAIEGHSSFLGFGETRSLPQVHYTIRMPATARLDVDVHNASITADGGTGLRVRAHNGEVVATNLNGPADVETHNGAIRLAYARYAQSRIETHNGACEVVLPADAKVVVKADTHTRNPISTDMPVTLRSHDDNYEASINGGGAELRFTAHNGTIRLRQR